MSHIPDPPEKGPAEWIANPAISGFIRKLITFLAQVHAVLLEPYVESPASGNLTLTGTDDQVVVASAPGTITPPATPRNQQQILIVNDSVGVVSFSGMTSAILGETMTFVYLGGWRLIARAA